MSLSFVHSVHSFELADQECYKHVQNNMTSQNISTFPSNPSKTKLPSTTLFNIEILSSTREPIDTENPMKSNEST